MIHPRRWILRFVLRVVGRPKLTLAVTLLLTAACIVLSTARLRLSSDQNKLYSKNVPFFRDFIYFSEQFPENEALYVIVEPHDPHADPPTARWASAADAIVARLRQMPEHVASAIARVPPDAMGTQGLLFQDPAKLKAEVEKTRQFVPLMQLLGEEPTALTRLLGNTPLDRLLGGLAASPNPQEVAPFVRLVAQSLTDTLAAPTIADAPPAPILPDLAKLEADDPERQGYFYLPDETDHSRHLLLVRVHPKEDYTSLTALSETVEAIRAAVADTAKSYPEFEVGITGRPALEADEMRTTDTDSTRAEIVALSAVFVGVAVLLRSLWLTIAAELALGVGIAWTFAWATLTLGELNLLSIVFMLALIGIGMDYLIQILSRYRREAALRKNPRRIWIAVFKQVGPPINTATLGAAGAFLVSLFTGFQGAADLGLIAGGGLLLCLLSGYTFLPALLTVLPMKKAKIEDGRWKMEGKQQPLPSPSSILHPPSSLTASSSFPFTRMRGPLIWAILLLIGIRFALHTRFDAGLLDLQAPNLRSVQLVRKLQTWSAVVLSKDVSALRAARAAIANLPSVDHTESLLDASDNYVALTQQITPLPTVEWAQPTPLTAKDILLLADKAEALANAWETSEKNAGKQNASTQNTIPLTSTLRPAITALRDFANLARQSPPQAAAARLGLWQTGFIDDLHEMLNAFHPSPPDYTTLPAPLKDHLVSPAGVFVLHIYPKEDLWNQDALDHFINEIEPPIQHLAQQEVPLTLTGIAHNIHHSTANIRSSFIRSTLLALLLIIILVAFDLRSLPHTLAAISVLALGLPMLVAIMGLLKIDWNFANFFGLPILIGAGHEYGVFMIHRYREATQSATARRRAWIGWDVTDAALLLCAFVTSSSFGFFFLLAHHQGLKSLGLVMALGSACIYLASVIVVRPILKWKLMTRGEK